MIFLAPSPKETAPTPSPTAPTSPPGGFRELLEGLKVSFDIVQDQKGPMAENIVPA
ncbi:hypothetical protein GCM10017779_63830 [Streptomyces capillispiralis]|nr:hypothetical protein GCM10017779_63830 [Streptomyces capillispiralis]